MTWDWRAELVFLAVVFGLSFVGKRLVFSVPAFAEMRAKNRGADKEKLARGPYREGVRRNNMTGLGITVAFYLGAMPFFIDLAPRPLWRHALDFIAVLMIYDFVYYLTHRFLFHGKALRKVHALHHQARKPTYIDALYVHPVETAIGLLLFFGTIPLWVWLTGRPIHAVTMGLIAIAYTYLNQLNHAWIDLPRFPFRTVDRIAAVHAAHHVDMSQGNYATITPLYDWLFGTFEQPVRRPAP